MLKKSLRLALITGCLTLFVTVGIYAATDVKDIIPMDNKAYEKHTKGIVEFSHKKHAEEYAKSNPDLYKNGCGECHHDDQAKPLSALKAGDDVQSCVDCHKDTTKIPKDKKLSKEEKIKQYHKYALHENCKGCHKSFNKAKGLKKKDPKAAPTDCKTCHPKKAK
jgi:Class III cytochrome C family